MFSVRCFISFLFYLHLLQRHKSEPTAATAEIFFSVFYNCLKFSGEILKSELVALMQVA